MTTRDRILAHLKSHRYRPVKTRALARFFDITEEDYPRFRGLVRELVDEGEIVLEAHRRLLPAPPEKELPKGTFSGILRLNPKGFGFIEPDDPAMEDDVFVPPGDTLDAISGDRVAARRVKRRGPQRQGQLPYTARVIEVVDRGQKRFVGTYRLRGKRGSIKPDGGLLVGEIAVPDASASGARLNDKVVFELLTYPAQDQQAQAVIVEVLGPRGTPGVDTLAVIRQFDLADEFSEGVLDAAKAAERFTRQAVAERTDLRDLMAVTIDPEDARDYDDAISIESLPGGIARLGVHIADVSFFVRPGDPLDTEARERGTSVYLPTTVLPMLPELLSNGMCSLQEGEDRLAQSVFIHYDPKGKVVRTEFASSIIRNKKRLTYQQVNEVLEEGRHETVEPKVLALLREMNSLARRILGRRRQAGYLELDLPDVDLVFDDQGQVVDAHPEDQSFSHKIIEMFMVEANEAVGRHLRGRRLPFIRRIHEEPAEDRLETMARFLKSCGHPLKDPRSRPALQALLKETRNTPASYPVHLAVLRSMMRTQYAVSDAGHWALASDCYCHFTSPIRRYPDLTVHRALAAVECWDGRPAPTSRSRKRRAEEPGSDENSLRKTAAHCTRTEQRAEAAERELTKVKVLTLLEKHVGEEYTGIVSAVAEYGMFIEIPKYLIEGLVHVRGLQDDTYEFDRRGCVLVGQRFGRKVRVGDTIRVVIAGVDIPRRQLDLAPAPGTVFAESGEAGKQPPAGARNRAADVPNEAANRQAGDGAEAIDP